MSTSPETINYADHIKTVEDFPEKGIRFYDIAPLIGNGVIFASLIHDIAEPLRGKITKVVGFDARGFIFGPAVAIELGVGFAMLRKSGKLAGETYSQSYDLEYGTNTLEIQSDAIGPQDEVLLINDVIATGGTALAGIELVRKTGARIVEFCGVIDLPHLGGSTKIAEQGVSVRSFVNFSGQ
jgi:adenine phosphoribosyltransferase